MEVITLIYLILMFLALYMFLFFVILTIKNKNKLFSYPEPKKDYFITLLIPAYNEEKNIARTIEHVATLNYPKDKLEIIAINDGSTDNTREVIERMMKKYSFVKLLDKPNSGKADSLNQGIKIARGEIIGVSDADSFPSKGSLRKLTGFFDNPRMAAVTSFVRVRNKDKNFLTKIQSMEYLAMGWARKLLDFVGCVYVTNGPLSIYRKKFLIKVGGFDPRVVTEDIDVTWNLLSHGYKTGMCLEAEVTTMVPEKVKPWFNQRVRWGHGGFQVLKKYRRSFLRKGLFGTFVIPFVLISILLGIFAFLFSTYLLLRFLLLHVNIFGKSLGASVPVLDIQQFNYFPSAILFYLLFLLICSWIYYNYVLNKTKYEDKLNFRRFFNLLFYLIVYLGLYSVVWFKAFYRFVRGKHIW